MKKENRQRRHLKGVRFDDQEMDILERGRNATNASSIPEYLRDSGIVRGREIAEEATAYRPTMGPIPTTSGAGAYQYQPITKTQPAY